MIARYFTRGPLLGMFELDGFGLHYELIKNMYGTGRHGCGMAPHRDMSDRTRCRIEYLCGEVYEAVARLERYITLVDSRFEHMDERVEA